MDLPEGSMEWGGLCREFAPYTKDLQEGAEWSLLMAASALLPHCLV